MPVRRGYIMQELCTMDNLIRGYEKSKHGKTYVHNMLVNKEFDPEQVLNKLQRDFYNGTYKTSPYTTFKVYEPKERLIFRLPYAPDRIAHHCIMNVMESFWVNKIPNTSYSCVKGRGVHGAWKYMKKCLKDVENTQYCFKCDIKKFFPSVNHEILYKVLCRYIKDERFLALLKEIVDSTDSYALDHKEGRLGYNLPIGNYLSQYFANLMMGAVFIELRKLYPHIKIIIYMDDMVVLSSNKEILHKFKDDLEKILSQYDLQLKNNYQIFSVDKQGISFVGFIFRHGYIRLRPNIVHSIYKLCGLYKKNRITKDTFKRRMASYYGWLKCADTKGLCQRIYDLTGIWYSNWKGIPVKITDIKNDSIRLYHITKHRSYFVLEAMHKGNPVEVKTTDKVLIKKLFSLQKQNKWNTIILSRC